MSFFSKLLGKQKKNGCNLNTIDMEEKKYVSEEYDKLVEICGKEQTDEIIKYWIQFYLFFMVAGEKGLSLDIVRQWHTQMLDELSSIKDDEFALRIETLGNICDERKMAEELDIVNRFMNDKSGKYHWSKNKYTIRL